MINMNTVNKSIKEIAKEAGIPYSTFWRWVSVKKIPISDAVMTKQWKPAQGCSVDWCNKKHNAKGYCLEHYTQWKKHGDPLVRINGKHGAGWSIHKGTNLEYKGVGKKLLHVLIAERALGKELPKGAVVHHIDCNKLNNSKDNLLICPDQKYHFLIHKRQKAFDVCGNANWVKCKYCHKYDDTKNLSFAKSGDVYHRKCAAERVRNASKIRRGT